MKAASCAYTPSDLMGNALDYAYKLWPRLRRYADNSICQIDNNGVERNQSGRLSWDARPISSARTTAGQRTMPFSIPFLNPMRSLE